MPIARRNGLRKRTGTMSEESTQKILVSWFRRFHRSLADYLTLASWGENIGARRMAQVKAMGLTPGYPDLFLALPTPHHGGLYIEMKTKTGTVSKVQKVIHEKLRSQSYKVEICRSYEEAVAVIEDYLKNTSTRNVNC